MRKSVEEITPDTVMQKVIPFSQVEKYLDEGRNVVRSCCSKASDTAPYVSSLYRNWFYWKQ